MTFEFKYSKQTEIDRLIFTFGSIVKGIYQNLGFLLLTENISSNKFPTVIIPDIPNKLTKEETEEFKTTDWCAGIHQASPNLFKPFENAYADIDLLENQNIINLEKEWNKLAPKFLKILEIIAPDSSFKKVVITPTLYGTVGSYHARKDTIYIIVRIDQPVNYIVSLVVRALVQYEILKIKTEDPTYLHKTKLWDKKEAFTDLLMQNTALKHLCPTYKSTLTMLDNPEIDTALVKESNANYAKIGFPVTKSLALNGLIIKLNNNKLEGLTETQNRILLYFLQNEGDVIKSEELAEIMWGKDYYEKFSLSAMAKMIHQLRRKLKDAGLQKEVIFTKRGKGYILIQ